MLLSKCLQFTFKIGVKVIHPVLFCLLLSLPLSAQPGRLDFNFPQILASGANVTALEIQADGKILAAGKFRTRGAVLRQDLIRLNPNGSLDTTFDLGGETDSSSLIRHIKLQPDGKILIAGYINRIGGTFVRSLLRLNSNGSIDSTFNLSGLDVTFVNDLDIQTDGRILISASNLIGLSFITRLKTDGSVDQEIGQLLLGGSTHAVTYVPTENKILVGGRSLLRLNINGSIDQTFAPTVTNTEYDLLIRTKVMSGGKILIFGKFDTVNGVTRRNIAILNTDGSLDTSFNPATAGAETFTSVAVQTDGKILIGGSNFSSNTLLRGNVARLNADGTIDATFNQGRGANDEVRTLKITNNKLLVGGIFYRYQIFPRSGLVRVNL